MEMLLTEKLAPHVNYLETTHIVSAFKELRKCLCVGFFLILGIFFLVTFVLINFISSSLNSKFLIPTSLQNTKTMPHSN